MENKLIEITQTPIVKALIAAIPTAGGPLDVTFTHLAEKRRRRKIVVLFQELEKGNINIKDQQAQSDEFIHCFTISTQAALRSHHDEKIRLFARAFANAAEDETLENVDEFEEIVTAIDSMSLREWQALILLDKFHPNRLDLIATGKIEDKNADPRDFYHIMSRNFDIKTEEAQDFLRRIERTGLIRRGGSLWGGGYGLSETTEIFARAKNLVNDRHSERS